MKNKDKFCIWIHMKYFGIRNRQKIIELNYQGERLQLLEGWERMEGKN